MAAQVTPPELRPSERPPITPTELVTAVRRLFKTPGYDPPMMPSVALEVHRLSRQPETSFAQIEKQIATDPILAARVIRVAQSPLYASASPIRSLRDATSRVGLRALGDLFLEVSMSARLFRAKGYEKVMERLRLHSVATAHAARLIARQAKVHEDYGYLVGLLHDVGIASIIIALSEPVVAGDLLERALAMPFCNLEQVVLQAHESAGAVVAHAWKMPPDLAMVIGNHHGRQPDLPIHPVVGALWIGEAIASACGFEGLDTPNEGAVNRACDTLSLQARHMRPLHDQIAKVMAGRA